MAPSPAFCVLVVDESGDEPQDVEFAFDAPTTVRHVAELALDRIYGECAPRVSPRCVF